jgi:hypothetical protein
LVLEGPSEEACPFLNLAQGRYKRIAVPAADFIISVTMALIE